MRRHSSFETSWIGKRRTGIVDMQQVKIFKGIENDLDHMEQKINTWLSSNHVEVLSMTGNIAPQSQATTSDGDGISSGSRYAPSDVIMFVLYRQL
jgi:hypothetical protein